MNFIYFNTQFAIQVHDQIIQNSGGLLGIINIGTLDSVLELVQNDVYYPTLIDKLTHLCFAINKNHSFKDGNKRSSIALCAYFLELNNLSDFTARFILEMENFVVDIADNRIDKDLLHKIIYSIIYEDDFSEQLKLEIVNAKSLNS
ncbi:MAG: death-on-curing protein [Niastella sp. SCN 39-18]|nr:type II toxin-antitoxin system death-on-curing family toxin [Sphingobacteriales bacterium]ODT52470.1 MAG: death-on-curing protein [Niastella sp. SCN 39-18]OJW11608.1 MAG: death-on-curing protein [Sphingobacteriales bacterium 39-19]